jgi:16S rRNA (guanine527-N7)-methyltransferase
VADEPGLLREGLERLGLGAEPAAGLLARYLAELSRWNARYGFVKADSRELVVKHALDSVAAARQVARLAGSGTVLDVGSGAGFPGIPLAIVLPEVRFVLLERSSRKAAFLGNCRALLGLRQVRVVAADLSAATGEFDVVTFRAVAPLVRIIADLDRSAVAWKWLAAYKGRADRVREELAALGPRAPGAEVIPLAVPFLDEERHLVVLPHGVGAARDLDNPPGRG